MSTHAHDDAHAHGPHRPVSFYIVIAVVLSLITAFELGPLFDLYRLPPAALLALSAIKFFMVVAFFMHLWDDAPVFTRLFAAPLIGATLMVIVLMLLAHTFSPSPQNDPLPITERHSDIWNQQCNSWLRSHASNRWYCASPPVDNARILAHLTPVGGAGAADAAPAVDLAAMGEAERKDWLMKRGEEVYGNVCAACHQANGMGVPPAFPPLAGSGAFYGDAKNHAKIIVHGLSGEIEVQGVKYNGAMPAQGSLSDVDIAAVATYERHSWGNNDGIVMPEDVAAVR
jgi:mono/diheme cytochrome c family protein/cytochrome c oxidase subunit IV